MVSTVTASCALSKGWSGTRGEYVMNILASWTVGTRSLCITSCIQEDRQQVLWARLGPDRLLADAILSRECMPESCILVCRSHT